MRTVRVMVAVGLVGFLAAGCGTSLKSYVKKDAPWSMVQRVAVLPFELPSENPVERQLIQHLFSEELRRRSGYAEVIEVPLSSPVGAGLADIRETAKRYKVDGVFSGTLDDTHGTVVHVRLQDAATEDLLWSGTYTLGARAEFLSLATQQQQFQRAFQKLVRRFRLEAPRSAS